MSFDFGGGNFAIGGAGFEVGVRVPNPLDSAEESESLEAATASEVGAIESAFVTRRKNEDKRKRDATDSEYWFAVAFRSRADKEAFLGAVGADSNQCGDKYLNGYALAALLGVEVNDG